MNTLSIRLLLFFTGLLITSQAYTCDLCNFYLSINPYDFKHSISINYRTISQKALFKAGPQFAGLQKRSSSGRRHSSGSYFFQDTEVDERFQIMDVWGKFYVNRKLQIAVNIPIEFNDYRFDEKVQTEVQGLGDISALGIYQVYNTKADTNNNWRQRFSLGGGVKLPTGNFKELQNGDLIEEDLQLGSGSLDFILLSSYQVRYKKLGLRGLFTYKINGKNNLDYSFANGLNLSGALFYQWNAWGKNTLIPEAGIYYEEAERDTRGSEVVMNTGGKVLFATYGVKVVRMPFIFEFNYQYKMDENLNDVQMPNNHRYIVGITYNIQGDID